MIKPIRIIFILLFAGFLTAPPYSNAQDKSDDAAEKKEPSIAISKEMDDVMIREATKVKEEFQQKARSLFDRVPLGWNFNTITYLYDLAVSMPGKIPVFTRFVIEQSKVLGVIGSILVLVFIAVVFYSLLGQRRVMNWVERKVEPLSTYIPEATYPFVMSGIKVVVSALILLLLLAAFALINALIGYSEAWFQLIGRLLGFWAAGALLFAVAEGVINPRPLQGNCPVWSDNISLGTFGFAVCDFRYSSILDGGSI